MAHILILGAGTAGTMAANMLRDELDASHTLTIVDEDPVHYYQPGFLFLPFGTYSEDDVIKQKREFLPDGVTVIQEKVSAVLPDQNKAQLHNGDEIAYDYLVIATGTHPTRSETPGLESEEYGTTIHDFYTFDGAVALRDAISGFDGGTLAINLIEMPIKCPVAPLEFAFLADSHFIERGIRDDVEIVYITPLSAAFTKPVAAARLGDMFTDKNIELEPDFYVERVDAEDRKIVSYDEREVSYDLLVTVPVNKGADFVGAAGIGDELNHVKVDPGNFQSTSFDNIFAIGDAAALPTSKAGSVAHFAM
ncbi:MAG: NAD(P)/FAD-dependent oxidoreductase, partial [Acidimicrobiia bacterium]